MIREVVLVGASSEGQQRLRNQAVVYLQRRLRGLPLRVVPALDLPELRITLEDWGHPSADIPSFDRLLKSLDKQGHFRLVLRARDWLEGLQAAHEVLNRYQRLLPLSRHLTPLRGLTRVLELHASHYPEREPKAQLARARSLDSWRWVQRLSSRPSEALQLATLFGTDVHTTEELELLADARDLAFFGVGSWAYLRERGLSATQVEVEHRLSRMSEEATCLALMTRQPPEISSLFEIIFEARVSA